MLIQKKPQPCCSEPGCCGDSKIGQKTVAPLAKEPVANPVRTLAIDFLYLDLAVCTRCQGTDDTLDQAIADISHLLQSAGIEVLVNKVNVNTEDLAIQYQFQSSPTIRIDGRDIAVDFKENQCDSCGDLCGDSVDCRIWTWQGVDYTQPPKAMLVDAILKAVYGASATLVDTAPPYELPENLRKFYAAMKQKDTPESPCCT
jgi:hypothetical protein